MFPYSAYRRRALVFTCAAAALLASPLAAVAAGETFVRGDLVVREVWARGALAGRNSAVFMTIDNPGGEPDRLVAARSGEAERAEIHTQSAQGGVMKMRPVEAVEVPAGGSVRLEPGGLHVMLIRLRQPLRPGERLPLELVFERAGVLPVVAEVREPGAMPADHGGGHGGGHD